MSTRAETRAGGPWSDRRRLDWPSPGPERWAWRVVLGWFAAWSLVGFFVVGLSLPIPGGSIPDVLFMLLASGVILLESVRIRGWARTLAAFGWVAVVSGVIEGVGAETGVPFGQYRYTDAFGYKLFGTLPVSIPLAWWVVVFPLYQLACARMRRPGRGAALWVALAVATAAVWVDLLLEPVATLGREYWIWEEAGRYYGVPAQNFLGWFLTAGLISLGLSAILKGDGVRLGADGAPAWFPWGPYSQGVLAVVVLTFVVAALVGGYPAGAVIGLGFLGYLAGSLRPFVRGPRAAAE